MDNVSVAMDNVAVDMETVSIAMEDVSVAMDDVSITMINPWQTIFINETEPWILVTLCAISIIFGGFINIFVMYTIRKNRRFSKPEYEVIFMFAPVNLGLISMFCLAQCIPRIILDQFGAFHDYPLIWCKIFSTVGAKLASFPFLV